MIKRLAGWKGSLKVSFLPAKQISHALPPQTGHTYSYKFAVQNRVFYSHEWAQRAQCCTCLLRSKSINGAYSLASVDRICSLRYISLLPHSIPCHTNSSFLLILTSHILQSKLRPSFLSLTCPQKGLEMPFSLSPSRLTCSWIRNVHLSFLTCFYVQEFFYV